MNPPGYDHVLVPFDGSDEAQQAAVLGSGLARVMGAELVLATVDELARSRERVVAKARAEALSDTAATVWLEPGRSPVTGLLHMLSFRPNALVCMATHGRTGVLRHVYGSLAQQLLRAVDAPVLLIGPRCQEVDASKLHHVIVAIDGTDESAAAIDLAARWAKLLGSGTTVVYTVDGDEIAVDIDDRVAPLVGASRALDKVAIPRRDLAAGLVDLAQPAGALIISAARRRSGLERHDQEAFTAKLSADSPVPVLVQRTSR